MTQTPPNQGSQKREDLEYWIAEYLEHKEKGLLDEEKANPKKKEEVEYWMMRYLERKRLTFVDDLYQHIVNLNSGRTDLFIYNKETADIQTNIKDLDVKLGLLRQQLGSTKKEEGVEYWMMKHQEEKKESLIQVLYGLTSEYSGGKLNKEGYDQRYNEVEAQLKAVSAKANLLRSRLDTAKTTEKKIADESQEEVNHVTITPPAAPKRPPLIREPVKKPPEQKKERIEVALGGYDNYKQDTSVLKVIKYLTVFIILSSLLLHLYLNIHCISAPIAVKAPDIMALLDLIKAESPGDYDMLCKYSSGIDYVGGVKAMSHSDRIMASDALLGYDDKGAKVEKNDKILAGNIIHEACHNMMYSIMGGYGKSIERDVERPCERMRYMFLYREGYYKSYTEMISALSKEEYGKKSLTSSGISAVFRQSDTDKYYKYGFLNVYCSKATLEAERVNVDEGEYKLSFKNTGKVNIHCGTIELIVNDIEYPLDCFDLEPGKTYVTGKDFKLKPGDIYSVRIVGC